MNRLNTSLTFLFIVLSAITMAQQKISTRELEQIAQNFGWMS